MTATALAEPHLDASWLVGRSWVAIEPVVQSRPAKNAPTSTAMPASSTRRTRPRAVTPPGRRSSSGRAAQPCQRRSQALAGFGRGPLPPSRSSPRGVLDALLAVRGSASFSCSWLLHHPLGGRLLGVAGWGRVLSTGRRSHHDAGEHERSQHDHDDRPAGGEAGQLDTQISPHDASPGQKKKKKKKKAVEDRPGRARSPTSSRT